MNKEVKNNTNTIVTLSKARINNLFNQFNYDYDFNNKANVSILIAPNGCGKTTILKFLEFIIEPTASRFATIAVVPFNYFECEFSDGKKIRMERKKIRMEHVESRVTEFLWTGVKLLCGEYVDFNLSISCPGKETISEKEIISRGHDEIINYRNETINYRNKRFRTNEEEVDWEVNFRTNSLFARSVCYHMENIFRKSYISCDIELSSYLLRASRFIPDVKRAPLFEDGGVRHAPIKKSDLDESISKIGGDIRSSLRSVLDEYNKRLSNAKDMLLKRFMESDNDNKYSTESVDFSNIWSNYIEQFKKYVEIGFIKSAEIPFLTVPKDDGRRIFMNIYVEEFSKTFEPFENIYDKFKMFADILNSRNRETKKAITFDDGELTVKHKGANIPLKYLSSGEKNDIVVFYQLIFGVTQGQIVLIDEPEISWHINWQEEFIDRLLEICCENNLQAIVSTHSPSILCDHDNLLVQGEGISYAE